MRLNFLTDHAADRLCGNGDLFLLCQDGQGRARPEQSWEDAAWTMLGIATSLAGLGLGLISLEVWP